MEPVLYILCSLAIGYIGLCLFYFLFQERLIFVPLGRNPLYDKIRLASEFEEVLLNVPNNGVIHSILIKARKSKGVILYFHGNTGNLKRWATIAEEFVTYDYDVFIPDYRGYGKSRGPRKEEYLFNDALQVFQWLEKKYPADQITIYGRSLGSAIATQLASKVNCKQLILETPFSSMIDVAKHFMPIIPARLLLRFHFRSDKYITQVKCPIAIFHGTKDMLVPYRLGLKLFNLISRRKDCRMITIPPGKHNDLSSYPLFREKMHELLD